MARARTRRSEHLLADLFYKVPLLASHTKSSLLLAAGVEGKSGQAFSLAGRDEKGAWT